MLATITAYKDYDRNSLHTLTHGLILLCNHVLDVSVMRRLKGSRLDEIYMAFLPCPVLLIMQIFDIINICQLTLCISHCTEVFNVFDHTVCVYVCEHSDYA